MKHSWIERAASVIAPQWAYRRLRANIARDLMMRHYEAATIGRRTQNWYRNISDANLAVGPSLARLRELARDLVRNNGHAESALATIVDHTIGWGIVPAELHEAWEEWAGTTAIDADRRCDLVGLEKLVMRTIVESGEVLIRRRTRRIEDKLPLPLQLQVLEPDFLDASKHGVLQSGGRLLRGVEFDTLGRRVAYWLFKEHPGSEYRVGEMWRSRRVPASQILHIFKPGRPGQVRGPSWFAPVLLRFKDFDEFEDATLMKQKIASCLAVITTDPNGTAEPVGTTTTENPEIDTLEPGMIANLAPGRTIDVVNPPTVREYSEYSKTTLRTIATGLGVTYEDLTGDYTNLPFSAARMSRLRHWSRVEDWRWRIIVPQLLDPIWRWAMESATIMGLPVIEKTEWTAPPLPMIEPDKEGLAIQRNIRSGIQTLSEAIRERGYNREKFLAEMVQDYKDLDRLGLVLDSDPRRMTQSGQLHKDPVTPDEPVTEPASAQHLELVADR